MKKNILSTPYIVATKIYELDEIEGKLAYFSELVRLFKGVLSPVTVSKSIDSLLDVGIITAKWEKSSGKWVRVFTVSNEARKPIAQLYESIEEFKAKSKS